MPKSSYQLGPIDAKEKATVEKILDINIPRLQSETGQICQEMTSSVNKKQDRVHNSKGRMLKSTFIGHVIYMQPKSITFKNLPATSSGTVLSPKLLWNLPFSREFSPTFSRTLAGTLPSAEHSQHAPWNLPRVPTPLGLAETHNINSIQLFLEKKNIKINHPTA